MFEQKDFDSQCVIHDVTESSQKWSVDITQRPHARPFPYSRPFTRRREADYAVSEPHVHVPPDDPLFGWYIVMIIALVLLGGLFSGLTLGLMGLDSVSATLEVVRIRLTARSTFKSSVYLARTTRGGRRPKFCGCYKVEGIPCWWSCC